MGKVENGIKTENVYHKDGTHHWQTCLDCLYVGDKHAHDALSDVEWKMTDNKLEHYKQCRVCGHEIVPKTDHTFGTWTDENTPTEPGEEMKGNQKRVCVCGRSQTRDLLLLAAPSDFRHHAGYIIWKPAENVTGYGFVVKKGADVIYDSKIHQNDSNTSANNFNMLTENVQEGGEKRFDLGKLRKNGTAFSLGDGDYTLSIISLGTPDKTATGVIRVYLDSNDRQNLPYQVVGEARMKFAPLENNENFLAVSIDPQYRASADALAIPATHNSKPVIQIAKNGFENMSKLSYVSISQGISLVDACAFINSRNLERVVFPNSLETISAAAFAGTGLRTVTLPAGLKNLGWAPFSESDNLESIKVNSKNQRYFDKNGVLYCKTDDLPSTNVLLYVPIKNAMSKKKILASDFDSNTTSIGPRVFASRDNIEEIVFPERLRFIGESSMGDCRRLKKITLPKSLEHVAWYAVSGAVALEEIVIDSNNPYLKVVDNVLYTKDGKTLIVYPANRRAENGKFDIPHGVMLIQGLAFAYSTVEIKFPSTLSHLAQLAFAFYKCPQNKLFIPSTVVFIGHAAFSDTNIAIRTSHASKPAEWVDGVDEKGYKIFWNAGNQNQNITWNSSSWN